MKYIPRAVEGRHDETLLWQYAARELDAEDTALTEHHLAECLDCRERLLDVRQARLVLQDAQTPRPQVLWAKVDQAVSQLVEARLVAKAKPSRVGWTLPVGFALAAACAAGVIAVATVAAKLDFGKPAQVALAEVKAPASSQVDLALGLSRVSSRLAAATEGERVVAGEVLRTAVGGKALLTLPDASRIRMAPGTQLALTRTEAADVALTLERGRVGVSASHRERRGFVVHTNGLSVRVVGTLFTVSQVAGLVEVVVAEGKVLVEPPEGHPLTLVAGERVRFERGGWRPLRGAATTAQVKELSDLSPPPLIEAAGAPRAPAAGKMPGSAMARREDPAARHGAVQQNGQVVGVGLSEPEPEPELEPLLPRKAASPQGGATVWPSAPAVGEAPAPAEPPPLEEKFSVFPSMGGGPVQYEPRVRKEPEVVAPQQKVAPIPGEVTAAPEVAPVPVGAPPVAQEFGAFPKVEAAPKGELQPSDLELLFLQRAERGLERGICDRYLLGLQEIASDVSRNDRAQQARILRARCFSAKVRPDLSELEYRRYLEVWPKGPHAEEARKAVLE